MRGRSNKVGWKKVLEGQRWLLKICQSCPFIINLFSFFLFFVYEMTRVKREASGSSRPTFFLIVFLFYKFFVSAGSQSRTSDTQRNIFTFSFSRLSRAFLIKTLVNIQLFEYQHLFVYLRVFVIH